MSTKEFTEEQIAELAANPYTHRVTTKQIAFTSEFKTQFWALYCRGVSSWSAMEVLGYDPEILGRIRIAGIQKHIHEEFKEKNGFHTGRSTKRPAIANDDGRPVVSLAPKRPKDTKELISDMQHEIQYMRQEIEFLKKISLAKTTKK